MISSLVQWTIVSAQKHEGTKAHDQPASPGYRPGLRTLRGFGPFWSTEGVRASGFSFRIAGGACSAGLPDGRSLVTGGRHRAGALASAAYFETAGRMTPAAPMLEPRADHVCVALEDGTVLVAGGDSGKNGATTAAA